MVGLVFGGQVIATPLRKEPEFLSQVQTQSYLLRVNHIVQLLCVSFYFCECELSVLRLIVFKKISEYMAHDSRGLFRKT